MHSKQICKACTVCAFSKPELCSAYRLASTLYTRERAQSCPDMETYLHYLQSGLADELALTMEDFLADIKARLTRKQYEVLISHVYHGRPLKDIARNEGITAEAARQRLNSAITKVRNEWGGEIKRKPFKRKRYSRAPR